MASEHHLKMNVTSILIDEFKKSFPVLKFLKMFYLLQFGALNHYLPCKLITNIISNNYTLKSKIKRIYILPRAFLRGLKCGMRVSTPP